MSNIDEKSEKLMSVLGAYLNKQDENPKNSLFHYTGFKGLAGILESRELWYTDHKYLNDPSEIAHGKNLIIQLIKSRIQDAKLQFILCDFISFIEKNCSAYVVSFCENGDYLPAWRYYGDNGAGFSIGFKKDFFIRSNDIVSTDIKTFYKIKYSDSPTDLMNYMFNEASRIHPTWVEQFRGADQMYYETLMTNLISTLPRVKNEDYRHEKEWRLCMMMIYNEVTQKFFPMEIPMDRFFLNPISYSSIPPFIRELKTLVPRIRSLKFNYSDIDSIFVGPRLDFSAANLAIEKMLINFGAREAGGEAIHINKSIRPYQ